MSTKPTSTPTRNFDDEFNHQLDNQLCGGRLCINPDCYCDEYAEQMDIRLWATDEATTAANSRILEMYLEEWKEDAAFFYSQVIAVLACSMETEELRYFLQRAEEVARENLPMVLSARAMATLPAVC